MNHVLVVEHDLTACKQINCTFLYKKDTAQADDKPSAWAVSFLSPLKIFRIE